MYKMFTVFHRPMKPKRRERQVNPHFFS